MAKSPYKAGKVIAPDAKFTGDEPVWQNWQKLSTEAFQKNYRRIFAFYGYYLTNADLRDLIIQYLKKSSVYTKSDIALYSSLSPTEITSGTAGKLIRAINMHMPTSHPDLPNFNPLKDIEEMIAVDIAAAKKKSAAAPIKDTKVQLSPAQKLAIKIDREIISQLEKMLDDWIIKKDEQIEPLKLTSFVRDGNIPAAGCKQIAEWLENQLKDFNGALNKECPQLVEGYSYLSKPNLKNRVKALETMIAEVSKVSKIKKAMRKPRAKKQKDASKQIARIKFQQNSSEYGVDSIAPILIPAAQQLLCFNTKNKQLQIYYANNNNGFTVQGTSLKEYDPERSFGIALRKPLQVLPDLLSSTQKGIEKILSSLKTTKKKVNGRINDSTILLKTFNAR